MTATVASYEWAILSRASIAPFSLSIDFLVKSRSSYFLTASRTVSVNPAGFQGLLMTPIAPEFIIASMNVEVSLLQVTSRQIMSGSMSRAFRSNSVPVMPGMR